MIKNSLGMALLLLISGNALHASAVNMKAQNTGKLLKGAIKIAISSIIGIQCGRYVFATNSTTHERRKVDTEEKVTIALLNIPNVHFFISGCMDMHKAIKNWQK